jgi:DNA-binding NarL/FixJ family response regulator
MSTKEIAALTNQSTRAIEVSRSRLRKKMDISGGINLSEFIRNIRF